MDWEVFAPEKYSMQYVDGDAIPRQILERVAGKTAESSVSRPAGRHH
jgi:hypothetical protein